MNMRNGELLRRISAGTQGTILCVALGAGFLCGAPPVHAQEKQGPQTPPPEHDVKRVTSEQPTAEAPPSMPQPLIIKHFAEKEEEYAKARTHYGYKKTIRLTEYGTDGNPMGEFVVTSTPIVASDGKLYERVTADGPSTLRTVKLSPEDLNAMSKIPGYPLALPQIEKYTITYVARELVDEVDCYLFQVKPKFLERANALFEGVVWVDVKYLEIVKSYGKFVTDLGDFHSPELPFSSFETYRENVEGKYWFPNYARSDDRLHFQDGDVPLRVVIKWTEFKPLTANPASVSTSAPASKPQ
jgi:hypothetical protein